MSSSEYDIFVSKADFKFNCAHFIAHTGFRERMHGHNYQISVKVTGSDVLSEDGYLIDFGDIKKVARSLCKSMNEYFICPMKSDVMTITEEGTQLCMTCEDGAKFSLPKSDCLMLPLVHSSAEEISHYLWIEIVKRIGIADLQSRGIKLVEVAVAEATQQVASFRSKVPSSEEEFLLVQQPKLGRVPQKCFDD